MVEVQGARPAAPATSMNRLFLLAPIGALLLVGCVTAASQKPTAAAGRLVAQRNCSSCHAIAEGQSPLADAPPFSRLYLRYGAGGLAELLEKGMIVDWPRPLEDGARPVHPRMPALVLGEDEVIALAEYLRTFEPNGPARSAPQPR
jgi:mono/diheme cytochrome c family protein